MFFGHGFYKPPVGNACLSWVQQGIFLCPTTSEFFVNLLYPYVSNMTCMFYLMDIGFFLRCMHMTALIIADGTHRDNILSEAGFHQSRLRHTVCSILFIPHVLRSICVQRLINPPILPLSRPQNGSPPKNRCRRCITAR